MNSYEQASRRFHRFTIGDRLRAARLSVTDSQGQFAEMIGVSRRTLSDLEQNKTPVKRLYLNAWVQATGFDPEWILTGNEPIDTPPDGGATVTDLGRRRNRTAEQANDQSSCTLQLAA